MLRRISAIFVLWVTASSALQAQSKSQAHPQQRFQEVAKGVFAGSPTPGSDVPANSGFVIGIEGVLIFDSLRPDLVAEMLGEIKKHTSLPVQYVINSHHHYELVLGNSVFAGATILAHENARKNLIAMPPEAQVARTRASNESLGLPNAPEERLPPLRLPTLTYTDRLVLYDGDREMQIIHLGRYHTNGDSVLFLPQEKILFSGDLLPGLGGPGGQREAYFRDFIQSIDKALALDFETIVPGRGDRLATKQDLRNFREYLAELVAQVQKFVDRGVTLEETRAGVKPPAYIDPQRLETASFKRLWSDSVQRAYAELSAAKSERKP